MKDIHLSQTSTRFNRYIHLLSFFQLCKDKLICSDALEKKGNDFGVLRSTHLRSKKKKKVKTTHSFASLCVSLIQLLGLMSSVLTGCLVRTTFSVVITEKS